ncbi:GT2 family glycosyltransferase [Arthrobacter sp. SLBN-53]|nr:GT2 family glycosyltransferase [Arthrobacter sp. SLBN-53]
MPEDVGTDIGRPCAPSVSVVVPTVGRPELLRALASVRQQTSGARVELIVVHDGGPNEDLPRGVDDLADRVLRTKGRAGGSHARNMGIAAAEMDFVALLDDDDEWLPTKLDAQFAVLDTRDPSRTVVSGRQLFVDSRTGSVSRPSPDRLIGEAESVEHYLFRRRPPSGGRPTMTTPTLLLSTELAKATEWDESLRRHQDWDWLVRLGRQPGISFVQAPDAVVRINLGSAGSISASTDWRSSLAWADRALKVDRHIYADFIAAQTLRYALAGRSRSGVRAALAALRRSGCLPAPGPAAIGIAGLMPRRLIDRVTSSTGGVR